MLKKDVLTTVTGRWQFDVENPLLYVFTNIVVWAVVSSTIKMVLLDGGWQSGALIGGVGGAVYGSSTFYLRWWNDET
ncbi:hypothetical protein [Halorussus sp. AFM4]|uniref:hypothetical protein n=1 Tax=Halorussus sp. AFM4 TaxID=3421651 RepID=UPI003EB76CEF